VTSFGGRRRCFTVGGGTGRWWVGEGEAKVLGGEREGEKAGWWAAALLRGGRRHWMVVAGAGW
jgi:hypothetical protein